MVAPGVDQEPHGASGLEFDVKDATGIVHVKSTGVPPQMFRENIGVVVEGTMTRAGYFQCNRLMVSHNNEYGAQAPMSRRMPKLIDTEDERLGSAGDRDPRVSDHESHSSARPTACPLGRSRSLVCRDDRRLLGYAAGAQAIA